MASDTVGGSVTLRLVNVPWDQALDVILRAKGLDKRRSGNVVWIAPQAELAKYEQGIADAKLKAEDTAELVTDYVPISYGKAADIAKLLTTGSKQGGGGGGGGNTHARLPVAAWQRVLRRPHQHPADQRHPGKDQAAA